MKYTHTLLLLFVFCFELSAQTFSGIDKQKVKFAADGHITDVVTYHSYPSNVYYYFWSVYDTKGRLISYLSETYQGFGQPWYKTPDTTGYNFRLTYKYDSYNRITEEAYYNNYRQLEIKCSYAYTADSQLTVTKTFYYGPDVDAKTVYKLGYIPAGKNGRLKSAVPELLEKMYYGPKGELLHKIKYSYGTATPSWAEAGFPYSNYFTNYLQAVKAYDGKGKLLEERKAVDEDIEGEIIGHDSIVVHKETDDYSIRYEDSYFGRYGNNFRFWNIESPQALDYINCSFNIRNEFISNDAWWDQEQYTDDVFGKVMIISQDKLVPGYEKMEGE